MVWRIIKKVVNPHGMDCIVDTLIPCLVYDSDIRIFIQHQPVIIRPLDDYLINGIKTRQQELAKRIGLELPKVNQECDYHRIIMHYVYLNVPAMPV